MTHWNRPTQLALLVIGALATSVAAQPAAAPNRQLTQQALDAARAHFDAAEAAKTRGDYQTAATEYLAAHELYPNAEFLFDVGEVYRLAGNEPEALSYYQQYLDLDPGGRGAAAARTAIDELRRSIAARQAAARRAADDEERRKQPATWAEVPPPAPATHAWSRDPIALTLLGTGVAAIGVGTGFLVSARSADHDERRATNYQQAQDAANRASRRSLVGSITGGVGAALVGGGVVWIVLQRSSGEPRTVSGWLLPGGGGLVAQGRF
jgi:tetratricopeptide (TPR) repeat protein